ncbi:MAG: hypothetical protein MJZ20_06925 [Bacteroidaceae bacterium]|nr:hypothetical protein [Bacteroidaceae bacterium]
MWTVETGFKFKAGEVASFKDLYEADGFLGWAFETEVEHSYDYQNTNDLGLDSEGFEYGMFIISEVVHVWSKDKSRDGFIVIGADAYIDEDTKKILPSLHPWSESCLMKDDVILALKYCHLRNSEMTEEEIKRLKELDIYAED